MNVLDRAAYISRAHHGGCLFHFHWTSCDKNQDTLPSKIKIIRKTKNSKVAGTAQNKLIEEQLSFLHFYFIFFDVRGWTGMKGAWRMISNF